MVNSNVLRKPGDVIDAPIRTLPGAPDSHQPVRIVALASAEEFMAQWARFEKLFGPMRNNGPEHVHFYRVITD